MIVKIEIVCLDYNNSGSSRYRLQRRKVLRSVFEEKGELLKSSLNIAVEVNILETSVEKKVLITETVGYSRIIYSQALFHQTELAQRFIIYMILDSI